MAKTKSKKNSNGGAVKVGRTTWVPSTKLAFYDSRKDEFLRAVEAGMVASGRFYDKMARLTLLRWGWDLPAHEDGPLLADPTDDAAMQWNVVDDDSEESARKKQVFEALKKRLGNWFRHRFLYVESNKKATGIVKEILSTMKECTAASSSKGDRMTALKVYRQENWENGLKEEFQEEWDDLKSTGAVSDGHRLKCYNQFMKRKFAEQSEDYVAELTEEATRLNAQKDTYIKRKGPETAQEYEVAMSEAGNILFPMAEGISQQLGAIVVIMCCGINSEGEIEVKTAQSKITSGGVPKIWPQWDPVHFTATEQSLKRYGGVFFSQEDRRARINGGSLVDTGETICISDTDDSEAEDGPTEIARVPPATTKSTKSSTNVPAGHAAAASSHSSKPNTSASKKPSSSSSIPASSTSAPARDPEADEQEDATIEKTADNAAGVEESANDAASTPSASTTPTAPASTTPDPNERSSDSSTTAAASASTADSVDDRNRKEALDGIGSPGTIRSGRAKAVPADLVSRVVTRPSPRPVLTKQAVIITDELPTPPTKDLLSEMPADNVGMRAAVGYLNAKCWCKDWMECVEALVGFERKNGFPRDGGRLSTDGRPASISAWMRGGRRWVDVEVDAGFAGEWTVWWNGLKAEADRSKLAKAGPNGMVVVVIGLAWWGCQIEEEGRRYKGEGSWFQAVREVTSMLHGMIEGLVEEDGGTDDNEPTKTKEKPAPLTKRSKRKAGSEEDSLERDVGGKPNLRKKRKIATADEEAKLQAGKSRKEGRNGRARRR
ncbi:hypothetical protein H0H92_004754 [Tricholoma furcatifolium]|nr:hypothetical protein H0H92_004754 [Tricholoma furcatifolium]